MKTTIDMWNYLEQRPKRGDLLHTNVGDRRERTFMILSVHKVKPLYDAPRYKIWAERWWQLEVDMRLKLFRSAERNGGQGLIHFERYRPKKRTLESWARRKEVAI
jgi:hypothetical protein